MTTAQIIGLVIVVAWAVFYFIPLFIDALLDPYADDFTDVDELVESERHAE